MDCEIGKITMKPLIALLSILICSTQIIIAGNLEEKYLKASALYQAGDYLKALSAYESLDPKGPAVWYNIGNCYFSLEKFPESIVAWRRAQKNVSWADYKTLEHYIKGAYTALAKEYSIGCIATLKAFFSWLILRISLFIWQIFFLICWFLSLWLLPSSVAQKKYLLSASLFLITATAASICYMHYYKQKYPYGLVTKKSISVYAGPGQDYAPLTTAQTLDMMHIYTERNGWLKVYGRQFGHGWVRQEDLAKI